MPPTDNLYKFIFISGILIYLYSLTFVVQQFRENRELEFKYKIDSIVTSNLIVKDSLKIEALNYQFKHDEIVNLKELNVLAFDSIILDDTQQKIFQEYLIISNQKSRNKELLQNITKRIPEPDIYMEGSRWVFYVLFIMGIVLTPLGFYSWYKKIHQPNMILLSKEVDKHQKDFKFLFKDKHLFIGCVIAGYLLMYAPLFILEMTISNVRNKSNIEQQEMSEQGVKSNSSTKIENATVIIYQK